jgi:RNA polymerase sigma-70 factor (ECF subfamily)
MPQPRTSCSPTGGPCLMDRLPKPPDSTDAWNRAWPQTRREFAVLVDVYLDRLVRYAYCRLDNVQDAEDVVQEVFVRSFADRSKRKAITAVGPYLYRSVANACTDLMRRRSSGVVFREDVGVEELLDHGDNPSHGVESADEFQRAEKLLGHLPQAQAEVVRLRLLEGLRLNEIADVVGCSVNTVSSRLRYGFHKLRNLVADIRE